MALQQKKLSSSSGSFASSSPYMTLYYGGGLLLRLALVAYGAWQDAHLAVKYTDIDYAVYTDAARAVAEGRSPFSRATYRYTPLLAYLLLPNIVYHEVVGKLLFIAADIAIGYVLVQILKLRGLSNKEAAVYGSLWMFHPFSINISTRGNADSIVGLLVLLSLYGLMKKQVVLAGLCYGLAVHFKIYPIVFALTLMLFLDGGYDPQCAVNTSASLWRQSISMVNRNRVKFALSSGGIFLLLGALFYHLYRFEFLFETYLYHVVRRDNRHNFSVYFYSLYLNRHSDFSQILGLVAFLPQVLLTLGITLFLGKDLPLSLFLHTLSFVTFNKYFVWYTSLLPLVLAASRLRLEWKGALMIGAWFATELHWLYWAYLLEFEGENTFYQIWIAGILFFLANVWIIAQIIVHQRLRPTFVLGKITQVPAH